MLPIACYQCLNPGVVTRRPCLLSPRIPHLRAVQQQATHHPWLALHSPGSCVHLTDLQPCFAGCPMLSLSSSFRLFYPSDRMLQFHRTAGLTYYACCVHHACHLAAHSAPTMNLAVLVPAGAELHADWPEKCLASPGAAGLLTERATYCDSNCLAVQPIQNVYRPLRTPALMTYHPRAELAHVVIHCSCDCSENFFVFPNSRASCHQSCCPCPVVDQPGTHLPLLCTYCDLNRKYFRRRESRVLVPEFRLRHRSPVAAYEPHHQWLLPGSPTRQLYIPVYHNSLHQHPRLNATRTYLLSELIQQHGIRVWTPHSLPICEHRWRWMRAETQVNHPWMNLCEHASTLARQAGRECAVHLVV